MAGNFLKLPRAAQKAAFAHMGDRPQRRKHADRGRISGFVGVLPAHDKPAPGGRGRIAGELPAGRIAGELPTTRGQPRARALGSGSRHQKLSAKAKNSGIEAQDPSRQRIDELRSAYEKGRSRGGEPLSGGNNADLVMKVNLSDGREAVRKRQTARDTRAEYLAGRVANALGIDDLTVAQVSDRDVVMNFVDGQPGAMKLKASMEGLWGEAKKKAFLKEQMNLRNGREIAMLDWLIDNDDRHALNWMVSPDGKSVIPIDHGNAEFVHNQHGKSGRHKVPRSPFVEEWVRPRMEGYREFVGADPQWSPAELAKIRASIDALRPEFTEAEKRWHAAMITRLDLLEGK